MMNPIKAVARRLHSHNGFTYVMDSTLWECDSCGERFSHREKARHPKSCPKRTSPTPADETMISELRPKRSDQSGKDRSEDSGTDRAVG
jgi:hypothetical protein